MAMKLKGEFDQENNGGSQPVTIHMGESCRSSVVGVFWFSMDSSTKQASKMLERMALGTWGQIPSLFVRRFTMTCVGTFTEEC